MSPGFSHPFPLPSFFSRFALTLPPNTDGKGGFSFPPLLFVVVPVRDNGSFLFLLFFFFPPRDRVSPTFFFFFAKYIFFHFSHCFPLHGSWGLKGQSFSPLLGGKAFVFFLRVRPPLGRRCLITAALGDCFFFFFPRGESVFPG